MSPVMRGTITKVTREEGSEWARGHTDDPKIRQLDTKDPERIAQMVAARGREVGIQYTHRESRNVNPHTGKPYDNYYFDGIVDDEPSTNGDGVEVVRRQERAEDPQKAWRISLAAGAKIAIASIPYLDPKDREQLTVVGQQEMALAWGYWLYTTQMPKGTRPAESIDFVGEPNPLDEPGPYIDDDWPPSS